MASLNVVILMGRVTRDPEVRYTPQGKAVVDVGMAIDDGYGDNKTTIWMDVTFWEKNAETIGEWVKKGHLFTVQGKLEQREHTVHKGKPEERREKKTKVRGITFTLMPQQDRTRPRGGAHDERPPDGGMTKPEGQNPKAPDMGFPPGLDEEDEIPF